MNEELRATIQAALGPAALASQSDEVTVRFRLVISL